MATVRLAAFQFQAGTGFYLYKPPSAGIAHGLVYLVTAKHIINEIRALGRNEVLIRCNLIGGGARWYETNIFDWHSHPDEDEVDVSVAQLRVRLKGTNIQQRPTI